MTPIQLFYFIAIVENGSMKKAAAEMKVTHSALSISLAALEKEFNTPLLMRHHNGCTPTADGLAVYNLAKKIQRQFRNLDDIKASNTQAQSIAIALLSPSLSSAIHHLNHDFMTQYPSVQISLDEYFDVPLESVLHNKKINFTFFLSYAKSYTGFSTYCVFSSPYVFCCSKKHPLAFLKHLSLADIRPYPLLVFIEQYAPKPHIAIERSYECLSSFATIKNLLMDDFNISLVPSIFLNSKFFMFNQDLCSAPATDFKLKLNGYIAHNPKQNHTEIQQNYLDFLKSYPFTN